jgi:hypothetical protein
MLPISGQSKIDSLSSWILTNSDNISSSEISVLSLGGFNFGEKYIMVGEINNSQEKGTQYLWKPRKMNDK